MLLRWVVAGFFTALLALSLQIKTANAQGAFVEADTTFERGATAIALADLDGDGVLDAWVGYNGASRIYQWQANAWVDSGKRLGDDNLTLDIALGDFDSDGDIDAATIDFDNLIIWINQGGKQAGTEGSFTRLDTLPTDLGKRIALGDVDNDSDLDIFLVRGGNRPDLVFINDGDANFTDSGLQLGDSFGTDIALGDIDGDGDLDAIIATIVPIDEEPIPLNEIWLNTTTHITPSAPLFLDSGIRLGEHGANALAIGDLDADGDLDVWLAGLASADTLWINQGGLQAGTEGTFLQRELNLGDTTKDVVFADVDQDGDLDAIVGRSSSGVGVWLNQSGLQSGTAGHFNFRGQNMPVRVERIAMGDVNNDQLPELFIAPYAGNSRTSFWINGDQASVDAYRTLRDALMRNSSNGRDYISLYEQFTGEITTLMLTDPTLNANIFATFALWQPGINALTQGQGDTVVIHAEEIKMLDTVLEHLALIGSEPLKAAIAAEREALGKPLDDFVGMTIGQASTALLGAPTHLLYMPNLSNTAQNNQSSHSTWQPNTIFTPAQEVCIILCALSGC